MQSAYRVPAQSHSGLLIPFTNGRSRKEPRAALRRQCRVRAQIASDADIAEIQGEMVNLSRSGLALQLAAALPVGIGVQIEVASDFEPAKSLDGRVVHCRRVSTGTFEVGVTMLPRSPGGQSMQRPS